MTADASGGDSWPGHAPLRRELRRQMHFWARVDLVATLLRAGNIERLLTIELDCQRRAIQVRGFANRPAGTEERKLLERWAKARGIDLQ